MTSDAPQKTAAPAPIPPRSPLWMRIALALSLAVNLSVAGVVAGALIRPAPERAAAVARSAGLGPWGPAFAREDRAALRRADQRTRRMDQAELARTARADRAAIAAALRADPFDPEAVRQINARVLAQGQARAAHGLDLVLEHVRGLDPQARLRMAERLEAREGRTPRPDARPDAGR